MKNKNKKMPWDWWNHNIHPILGIVWKQPNINKHVKRNNNELNNY